MKTRCSISRASHFVALIALIVTSICAIAVSPVGSGIAVGVAVRKPPTAEAELQALAERGAEARADMSRWLRETPARDEHLHEKTIHVLSLRMEHRIHAVSAAYGEFLGRHPGHLAASAQHETFMADTTDDLELIREWELSRAEKPESPSPWNLLAHRLLHGGRVLDAFACFEKSLELAPREAEFFFDFATAMLLYRADAMSHFKLSEAQLFDRVLLTYRRGMKLEPENFQLAEDYARTFYVIRPARSEQALAAWEAALKLATTEAQRDSVRTHLARHAIQTGKLGIARLHLDLVQDPVQEPVKVSLLRRIDDATKGHPAPGEATAAK